MLNITLKNRRPIQLASAFSFCIFLLHPMSAISAANNSDSSADEPALEQVTVTADFRNQTALNSASSITVIGQDKIANRAAQHFEEIIPAIPNFSFAGGTNRARFFQIRGIGERSQFVQPLNTSVGVLIDEVDFSGAASVATL